MAREVDVAIRYVLQSVDRGVAKALALTKDLDKSTKQATTTIEQSAKVQQRQWQTLERMATQADTKIAVSAIKRSQVVNAALDKEIAKQRELGVSYEQIIRAQHAAGRSAAELASTMERSSARELEAMRRVRTEAAKPVRQHISEAVTSARGGAGRLAGGALALGGSALLGGTALAGGVAYAAYHKASGVTEDAYRLQGQTGVSQQQALQLAIIAQSQHDLPTRTLGMSFATASSQLQKALQANRTGKGNASTLAFSQLGITPQQAAGLQNNIPGLVDTLHSHIQGLGNQTQQAQLARTFFGRGASQLGPLFKEGPISKHMEEIGKQTGGLTPADMQKLNVEVVKLNEQVTLFELKFIKAFGPEIRGAIGLASKAMGPVGSAFTAVFKVIEGVLKGPVGQALGQFGKQVFGAGKQLVEAFKPALPFLQNIILPLLKGVAIGVATGIIATIKVAAVVIKVFAGVLGLIGTAAKPLKPLIEDVGKVIGFVFGPGLLGKIAESLKAVGGVLPVVGKGVELLAGPFEAVGKVFGTFLNLLGKGFGLIPGIASRAVRLMVGVMSVIPGAVMSVVNSVLDFVGQHWKLLIGLLTAPFAPVLAVAAGFGPQILGAFTGAFGSVEGFLAGLPGTFLNFGKNIISGLVSGIQAAPSAIVDAIKGLLPGPLQGAFDTIVGAGNSAAGAVTNFLTGREGGVIPFANGGLVPALVSSGEQVIHQGRAMTVPGARVAADNVLAMLPHGAAVMTDHGQHLMAAGHTMDEALSMQMPHFAAGGWALPGGGRGGHGRGGGRGRGGAKPRMRYDHHRPVGVMDESQWQAYQLKHGKSKQVGFQPHWTTIGATVYDDAGATSSGKHFPGGFAELSPPGLTGSQVNFNTATALGKLAYGTKLLLRQGPNAKVVEGAKDDIGNGQQNKFYKLDMGRSLAQALGVSASTFKGAIQIASASAGTPVSALGSVAAGKLVKGPKLSSKTGLDPMAAFQTGFDAGLKGDPLSTTSVVADAVKAAAVTIPNVSPGGVSPSAPSPFGNRGRAMAAGGSAFSRMVAEAGAINAKQYNYEWAGGHNPSFAPTHGYGHGSGPGIGYDCSGSVSKVLRAGNALTSPLDSTGLMSYGQSGPGKRVSIFASPTHTVMSLGGRFFGTSSHGHGGGASWMPGQPESFPATRHPPGLRRGGRVGHPRRVSRPNFAAAGAYVGSFARGPSMLTQATKDFGVLAKDADSDVSGKIGRTLTRIGSLVSKATMVQLDRTVTVVQAGLHAHGLTAIGTRRLQSALAIVDAQIGNRLGLMAHTVQGTIDKVAKHDVTRQQWLRIAAVDPSSSLGLTSEQGQNTLEQVTLQAAKRHLEQIKLAAKRHHAPKAVLDELSTRLDGVNVQIAETVTHGIELIRDIVKVKAQEMVDKATHGLNMATGSGDYLAATQRIAGTAGTPGADIAQGNFIQRVVIPAMQAQLPGLEAQYRAAVASHDTTGTNAASEALQAAWTAIVNKAADAADLFKQAATNAQTLAESAVSGKTGYDQSRLAGMKINDPFNTGGQSRADFIRQVIVPDLNAELVEIKKRQVLDAKDPSKYWQDLIDGQNKGNEIAQAGVDATSEVASNTQTLKDAGGTLSFAAPGSGQNETDLAGIGLGA